MNNLFAKTKNYDNLYYDEIFIFYDEPCLFSLKNKLGYRYIAILESECNNFDLYLIVPVSLSRYQDFVTNKISIKNIYINSELENVFLLKLDEKEFSKTKIINVDKLLTMNLPDEKEYLDFDQSYTNNKLLLHSVENKRAIAQLSFEKNKTHINHINASELSIITKDLQKIFNGIAKDWLNSLSKTKTIRN